jgi:hypothetical protein
VALKYYWRKMMTNKHTELPWKVGRISKEDQTVEIDAPNGHSGNGILYNQWTAFIECVGSNDEPEAGIAIAEANARYLCTAVNYHHRLREALWEVLPDVASSELWEHGLRYDGLRALLDELDNLEKQ